MDKGSQEQNFFNDLKSEVILRNNENLERIISCLNLLNETQIWYRTNSQVNSVANLVLHLGGNITQYITTSLTDKVDQRKRALEFSTEKGHTKKELEILISECIKNANNTIEKTSKNRIMDEQMVQGFSLSGMGNMIHACEHLSYHTGQIALMTKILTNTDLGFYSDVDLDIT